MFTPQFALLDAANIFRSGPCRILWPAGLVHLVRGVDEDEEAGQHLSEYKQVAEEPALSRRREGGVEMSQMLQISLIVSEGIEYLTVPPEVS